MFGLSSGELLIILVVALIFIGPKELPKVARKGAKLFQQVRGVAGQIDLEVRKTIREVTADLDENGDPLNEAWHSPRAIETEADVPVAQAEVLPEGGTEDVSQDVSEVSGSKDAPVTFEEMDEENQAFSGESASKEAGGESASKEAGSKPTGRGLPPSRELNWEHLGQQAVEGQVAQNPHPRPVLEASPDESEAVEEASKLPKEAFAEDSRKGGGPKRENS